MATRQPRSVQLEKMITEGSILKRPTLGCVYLVGTEREAGCSVWGELKGRREPGAIMSPVDPAGGLRSEHTLLSIS